MAKAKNAAKKKSPRKMVWRISKFSDRFEFKDDKFKQKPLNYTKNFAGSGPDAVSVECTRQINDLRMYNDRIPFSQLKGVFFSLTSRTADAGILLRSYILDGNRQPASNRLIGIWEMVTTKEAGKIMEILAKVGLIEKVELPDFDNPEPTEDPEPDPPKPKTKAQIAAEKKKAKAKAAAAKKAAADAAKAENTESAENQEKNETLQERQNGKTANGKNGKPESQAASGKTANPESEKETALTGQGQSQGPQEPMPGHLPAAEAAEGAKGNATLLRAKTGEEGAVADAVGQANDSKAPDEPANAHKPPGPHKPTEADGSGSRATADTDGSPVLTEADGGASLTSGTVASGGDPPQHYDNSSEPTFEQKYSPECREFAVAIYQAIRGRHPIGSPEAYRELATFATQWSYAQESAIGDTQLGVLWGKAVMEATKLGRKRRMRSGPRSPEAVWITVFKGRLAKMVAGCGTEAIVTKAAHA